MSEINELYPVFMKVNVLHTLIVGGGNVGLEKLTFLLKSSPNAHVTVVSKDFHHDLVKLAEGKKVKLIKKAFEPEDMRCKQLIIATTDSLEVNKFVHRTAKQKGILVNVADNPPYCDFYMGGIVTKGNIKIAISTNGKSPTIAKRLRQYFEAVIPDDMEQLLKNLTLLRSRITGGFEQKVKELNEITAHLVNEPKL
ncbi:MAG: bifunctional precorrin-2 dehydrogenase/sirohydrochlorin ferrochelatase [Flavobacteriales bacterium]